MLRFNFNNGLILGAGDYQLESPISGLENPAMRNSDGLYTALDGGYMLSQYYGHRTIVLKGFFFDSCFENLDQKRKFLLEHLYMRYLSPITIEDIGNNYYLVNGYVTDIKAEITSITEGEFQITILCPDPAIYNCASWNDNTPVVLSENLTVNGEVSFIRQGDFDMPPVITLAGKFTNPEIIINDSFFKLNLTTDSSSRITIDMKARTVLDNGGSSLIADRTIDSKWLYLGAGSNVVSIMTDDNSDSGTATLTYSAGYRGI